jgi:dihydroflavonol-4-reductase
LDHNTYIAVTGGTGHLGRNLIDMLLQQGQQVKALKRNLEIPYQHPNLTWIQGDLSDLIKLNSLLDNSTAVIHCASAISLGELDQDFIYDVNVTGTSNLLEACSERDIKFIYISSSTAVQDSVDNEVFDENRPYKSDTKFYYAFTKAIAEQRVLSAVEKNNLDACIIRPTAIIGPADNIPSRFGVTILDLYRAKLPFITDGGYNMIDVRDLSQTIINCISMGKKGRVYLTGGQYLSLKELSKLVNPNKIPMRIPVDFLILILPLIKLYDKLFKLKWPISSESLYTLKYSPKKMDSSRAIKELQHHPRPIKNTIDDLITWFKENK